MSASEEDEIEILEDDEDMSITETPQPNNGGESQSSVVSSESETEVIDLDDCDDEDDVPMPLANQTSVITNPGPSCSSNTSTLIGDKIEQSAANDPETVEILDDDKDEIQVFEEVKTNQGNERENISVHNKVLCFQPIDPAEYQFNKIMKSFLEKRSDNEKPLWTRQRIEEAIGAIELYKLAPLLKLQRTRQQCYYAKKYDVMEVDSKKILILKRTSDLDPIVQVVPVENFYKILRETHHSSGHGGRDKMFHILKTKYLIPTHVILEFLNLCLVCQSKKRFLREGVIASSSVSMDFNHRGQVDLIDLQSTPDGNYKWIMHYEDQGTKFSFLRPLTSNTAGEVATELLKIFLEVGCPGILHSDNGREFTAGVITELRNLWPTCKILNGKPSHPASQGSVMRPSRDIESMLRGWLINHETNNWSVGCYFVQFLKNSSFHRIIKRTPYKALFGTEPKTGLPTKLIPKDLLERLVDEEDLGLILNEPDPTPISIQEDLPAASSATQDDSGLKDLINYEASTSNTVSADISTNSETPVSYIPPTADSIIVSEPCVVCGMEATGIHTCPISDAVHEI